MMTFRIPIRRRYCFRRRLKRAVKRGEIKGVKEGIRRC
jgi:hypothetical protein